VSTVAPGVIKAIEFLEVYLISYSTKSVVQVDGLIVNCTAFNPTPSLSAAVVKHFKFKSSIRTVNLSGMGCAASVIAVDIARDMLKVSSLTFI